MKYKVIKSFGKYKVGAILNDKNPKETLIIHRKKEEGGTIVPLSNGVKMDSQPYENKMDNPKENKKK